MKKDFEKDFNKLMNIVVFGKTMENVRKQRYQTCHNRKKKKLFGARTKSPYYNVFHRKFISNSNEKTVILMNKPVYLGLSILELSIVLMYEFWYDHAKPKYREKTNFVIWIQTVSLYT